MVTSTAPEPEPDPALAAVIDSVVASLTAGIDDEALAKVPPGEWAELMAAYRTAINGAAQLRAAFADHGLDHAIVECFPYVRPGSGVPSVWMTIVNQARCVELDWTFDHHGPAHRLWAPPPAA
ncbi:hypothetical protein [Fodinicola feengrottensis]|uniref:hypothetical protein n=1 Tax=Fodinicola feengrottensis TaxID=435914 RepID=UPI0013D56A0F|nr:hypothetical protein [Fodinicola feengrottensis]